MLDQCLRRQRMMPRHPLMPKARSDPARTEGQWMRSSLRRWLHEDLGKLMADSLTHLSTGEPKVALLRCALVRREDCGQCPFCRHFICLYIRFESLAFTVDLALHDGVVGPDRNSTPRVTPIMW